MPIDSTNPVACFLAKKLNIYEKGMALNPCNKASNTNVPKIITKIQCYQIQTPKNWYSWHFQAHYIPDAPFDEK